MNYTKALEARKIIDEIEQNNKDIRRFEDAIKTGIIEAQITIKCKEGIFNSTIYENNRIGLLLQILYHRNVELMERLEKL